METAYWTCQDSYPQEVTSAVVACIRPLLD